MPVIVSVQSVTLPEAEELDPNFSNGIIPVRPMQSVLRLNSEAVTRKLRNTRLSRDLHQSV